MRRLVILLIVLVVGPASAQDDSHLRAAKDLLSASNAEQMLDAVYTQFDAPFDNMAQQLSISEEQRPIFDRYRNRVIELVKEEMNWEKMEPRMAELYAEYYTEEELIELTQFYLSPIGQKFLSKMPELMQASMQLSQSTIQGLLPRLQELQTELQDELAQSESEGQ